MDNETSGTGNMYDYGFRIYNPRIAKFLSVDPLTGNYPGWSPYPFAMNRVIDGFDLDGLEYKSAATWADNNIAYKGISYNQSKTITTFRRYKNIGPTKIRNYQSVGAYCGETVCMALMNGSPEVINYLAGKLDHKAVNTNSFLGFARNTGKYHYGFKDWGKADKGDVFVLLPGPVGSFTHVGMLNDKPVLISSVEIAVKVLTTNSDGNTFGKAKYYFKKNSNGQWDLDRKDIYDENGNITGQHDYADGTYILNTLIRIDEDGIKNEEKRNKEIEMIKKLKPSIKRIEVTSVSSSEGEINISTE